MQSLLSEKIVAAKQRFGVPFVVGRLPRETPMGFMYI